MIPIMMPQLPTADKLLPYLQRIDKNHWYSNYGPLNTEYEARLSKRYKCHVVTCSSATSGLTASLMAVLSAGKLVGMPGWTFAATASAIFAAGCRPGICDVGEDNAIDISTQLPCDAYMPVMPLGAPIDLGFWENMNIPIVIDGAGGFDSLENANIGNVPIVVSTHATKVFGTGEGGFVLSKDEDLIQKIRIILNQGMNPDKSIAYLGFNGKLSEYHAAVGLAELDNWQEKAGAWERVQVLYGEKISHLSHTHIETLPENVDADEAVKFLAVKGIMARRSWYGICHLQDVYRGEFSSPTPRTEKLRQRTLFLPKYVGMTDQEIDKVLEVFKDYLNECN